MNILHIGVPTNKLSFRHIGSSTIDKMRKYTEGYGYKYDSYKGFFDDQFRYVIREHYTKFPDFYSEKQLEQIKKLTNVASKLKRTIIYSPKPYNPDTNLPVKVIGKEQSTGEWKLLGEETMTSDKEKNIAKLQELVNKAEEFENDESLSIIDDRILEKTSYKREYACVDKARKIDPRYIPIYNLTIPK